MKAGQPFDAHEYNEYLGMMGIVLGERCFDG